MVALAAWVLRIDPRSPVNRAFALLFVVRGALNVLLAFAESENIGLPVDSFWARSHAYFALAMPFAVLHFVHRYRARYAQARRIPGAGAALGALAVAVIVAYLVEPTLYLGDGTRRGPLALTAPVFYVAYGVLSALFLRDHFRDGSRSALHLGIAFGLLPVSITASGTISAFAAVARGDPVPQGLLLFGWTGFALFAVAGLTPFLALLSARRRAAPEASPRAALVPLAVAAASGVVPVAAALLTTVPPGLAVRLVDQFWTAAFVVLVTYALVRHQLLDVDVKVRWGVSRSTVAAVFVAVFFVASEGAQVVFGRDDPWLGVLGAGALVFALAPLQRFGDRLAERAVPVVERATGEPDARETTYRKVLARYLGDGRLSRDEEVDLARLAQHLGIDPARAVELRHEAADARGGGR